MCFETAAKLMTNGSARSPTLAGPSARRARIARLVGSARAPKMRLSRSVAAIVSEPRIPRIVRRKTPPVPGSPPSDIGPSLGDSEYPFVGLEIVSNFPECLVSFEDQTCGRRRLRPARGSASFPGQRRSHIPPWVGPVGFLAL